MSFLMNLSLGVQEGLLFVATVLAAWLFIRIMRRRAGL